MKYQKVAILVLLGSLASVPGCRSSNRVPYYTICIKNESGTDIPDVRVLFGTTHAVGGFLRPGQPVGVGVVPGGFAFQHGIPLNVPEKANIIWKSEDGKQHEQEVEVKRLMPSRMSEVTIFFVIRKDGSVLVKALTEKEMDEHKYPYGDN